MQRGLTIIGIAVAIAATGCGGGGSKSASGSNETGSTGTHSQSPGARAAFPGIYAEALRVCSQAPVAKVARNAHTTSTNPTEVARAVARGYLPKFRSEAFKGCRAGLKLVTGGK